MPKKKTVDTPQEQSRRFIEMARKLGADETGKKFQRASERVNDFATPGGINLVCGRRVH